MKKRIQAVIAIMLILCMSLSGCGNATQETAAKTEAAADGESAADTATETDDGVVRLTVWAEEANWDVLNKMIESFKQEHAGEAKFEITLVQNADAETKNVLLGDIYNGADIFPIPDDQMSSLVAAGALASVPNAEEVKAANMEDAVAAACVNDVLYAYPMTADNGYFMYYDKRYFTEEDLKTLDGMLTAAEAAGKKITMDWSSGWYLYAFFGGTGMEFGINEDGVTNHCNWNRVDGSIKGTDVAEALLAIAAHPGFANMTDADFMAGVQDGSVIAGVSGVWNEVEVRKAWGDNYGAVKLPTYTCAGQQIQMSSFKGYKMMGVNYYSAHKDWALKLADWFTNEQNQTLRFEERSQGPSNKNAAASDTINQVPAIQAVIAQSEYGVLQRVGNSYWDATTEFGGIMAAGNPSGKDLQEIMDTMVAGITASTVQ
ncbi:MAG: extracellular solute-binding protein [Lachnospiraceae bacterium]|nr:extracellular solute-binding protein [Lachnospiraceae bacterium]